MSSTCSVLPRDLVPVEVAASDCAPPSDLVDHVHVSGALTGGAHRKGAPDGKSTPNAET